MKSTIRTVSRRSLGWVAVLVWSMVSGAQAAEKIRDGAGANRGAITWSNAENWLPDGIPANGDSLIFGQPYDALNTNDLLAFQANWIWFSNGTWVIKGNGISLTGGLTNCVNTTQAIDFSIATTAAQVWHLALGNPTVLFTNMGTVALNSGILLTGTSGTFRLIAPITGSGAITSSL